MASTLEFAVTLLYALSAAVAVAAQAAESDPSETFGMTQQDFDNAKAEVCDFKFLESLRASQLTGQQAETSSCTMPVLGDLTVTPGQITKLYGSAEGRRRRRRRKRAAYIPASAKGSLWKKDINYFLDLKKDTAAVSENVRNVLAELEAATCLKFKELTERPPLPVGMKRPTVFVNFVSGLRPSNPQCYSTLGFDASSFLEGQMIDLSCFDGFFGISEASARKGKIRHLIGHTLGLFHEVTRPDRDDYVAVNLSAISLRYAAEFSKISAGFPEKSGPYDFASVMHFSPYHRTAMFPEPRPISVITKDPAFQKTIGQSTKFSFLDLKAIDEMICHGDGTSPCDRTCQNDGFPNQGDDCATCVCPDGFGGADCSSTVKHGTCLGNEAALSVGASVLITSGLPSYDADQRCAWQFKAPAGCHVAAEFSLLETSADPETGACRDYVEVRTNPPALGPRLCSKPPAKIASSGTDMMILFDSTYSSAPEKRASGFLGSVSVVCPPPPTTTAPPTTTTAPPTTTTAPPTTTTAPPPTTTTAPPVLADCTAMTAHSDCAVYGGATGACKHSVAAKFCFSTVASTRVCKYQVLIKECSGCFYWWYKCDSAGVCAYTKSAICCTVPSSQGPAWSVWYDFPLTSCAAPGPLNLTAITLPTPGERADLLATATG